MARGKNEAIKLKDTFGSILNMPKQILQTNNSQLSEAVSYYCIVNWQYLVKEKEIKMRDSRVQCEDHLGNKFESIEDMCTHWKISVSTFYCRRINGHSVMQSLTGEGVRHGGLEAIDHLNEKFSSVKAMCEHWGVSEATFKNRIGKGYSVEQSLTGEGVRHKKSIVTVDHLNQEFPSVKDMCEHWKVNTSTFRVRQEKGYSLEACLTGKGIPSAVESVIGSRAKACKDHLDNEFRSVTEMCKYWNINASTFINRCNAGYTLEEALTGKGVAAVGRGSKKK